MAIDFSKGSRLTNRVQERLFEERAIGLCKILERGGVKITDSAMALSKKSLLKQ